MRTDDRTEEQVLVMRAQRGEQDAFAVLVERYRRQVFTVALRMVNQREDAEDVAQEVFLSAWRSLPNFRMDAAFSTYLYRLTVNAATDLLRRRKKEAGTESVETLSPSLSITDSAPTPQQAAEQAERRDALYHAIGLLSDSHRKILLLREIGGLDYREIAQALELTPGTVKSRLSRARLALREKLTQQGNLFDCAASNDKNGG